MAETALTIADIRHPDYLFSSTLWTEWRETFRGGDRYLQRYLQKFSTRESDNEFAVRKSYSPIPTFAKAAILDIRNSIFQRLGDVTRVGGSTRYHAAVDGEEAGVDREGGSMSSFIGIDVLTELLVMGRCGIYVDAPAIAPTSLAEEAQSPYLYYYQIEDILSWTLDEQAEDGTFKAVLLRDHAVVTSTDFGDIRLPSGRQDRYRLVWKDDNGDVWCRFYNSDKEIVRGEHADPITGDIALGLKVIPFVMPSIGDSLLTDVSSYQKALLNLVSADVNWALQSNVPFLTIQQELRTSGAHLKRAADDATPGGQPAQGQGEAVGGGTGRYYDIGTDRPDYIAPPTDPLLASMKLQEKLEDDIRKLINLAVTNKSGSRTESAEAKKLSSQGLEAGLSFIGMVLQKAEQAIARYWSMYENKSKPDTSKVAYPDRYLLKEDVERIDEAESLLKLIDRIPSKKARKVVAKIVISLILTGKVPTATIDAAMKEVEKAGYTTSAIQDVLQAQGAGLMSDELASEALGIKDGEVEQARKDLAKKHALTLMAQTSGARPGEKPANPTARGVPELGGNPKGASQEQAVGTEKAKDKQ